LESAAGQVLAAARDGGLRWHETKDRTVADRVRVQLLEALVALDAPSN
jgi:hypothetical protein